MQHKCRMTVIDKKLFPDLQARFLARPDAGACRFYEVGDTFLFERYGGEDTFWTMGRGSQCAEAWDCVSRYVYAALQGGSIMRGWTNDERMMVACCNDGTRPVIFRIERLDYLVLKLKDSIDGQQMASLQAALSRVPQVQRVDVRPDKQWAEIFCDKAAPPDEAALRQAAEKAGFEVAGID